MPSKRSDFAHLRQFPQINLIKRITMRANQLITVLRKNQIANLAASIQAKSILVAIHVPKPNAFIGGAAAGSKEIMVERRPGDGFDRSAVRCGFEERLRRA